MLCEFSQKLANHDWVKHALKSQPPPDHHFLIYNAVEQSFHLPLPTENGNPNRYGPGMRNQLALHYKAAQQPHLQE